MEEEALMVIKKAWATEEGDTLLLYQRTRREAG